MNCAAFVDFESLFRSLQERSELGAHRPRDAALTMLENLKAQLLRDGMTMVMGRSYAAFDTYPGMEVAHDLALMGFDPVYTLAHPHGSNSASVQIAVDVSRVVFRRPDIEAIVVVAGDGDLIPIARQVLEEGRNLRVVALPDAASGDLRLRVGAQRFVNALDLLPGTTPVAVEPEVAVRPLATPESEAPDAGRAGAAIVGHIPVTWGGSAAAEAAAPDLERQLHQCLDLIVRAQARHGSQEVWLSPFLKGPLTQQFGRLIHPQRRALVNELRNRGVIRVEVRENQFADHPYSVIVLQDDHPWVIAAVERLRRA